MSFHHCRAGKRLSREFVKHGDTPLGTHQSDRAVDLRSRRCGAIAPHQSRATLPIGSDCAISIA